MFDLHWVKTDTHTVNEALLAYSYSIIIYMVEFQTN